MSLEKELHVVIKLPFRRPSDFVEPPPIVWTEDMEHQLWKHITQKHTDWKHIAEQLGVPTPYLVRHAAFMYETQLRGIQQQLRLNVSSTSISTATIHRSNTLYNHRQVSGSVTFSQQQQQQRQQQQQKQQQQQQQQQGRQPISILDLQFRDTLPVTTTPIADRSTTTSFNDTVKAFTLPPSHMSPISRQSDSTQHLVTADIPVVSSASNMNVEAAAMQTAPMGQYPHLTHDNAMVLTATSNVAPRKKSDCNSDYNSGTDKAALASQNDIPITDKLPGSLQNRPPDIVNTTLSSQSKSRDNIDLQKYGMGISDDYNTCVGENEDYGDCADTLDDTGSTRTIGGSKTNDNSDDSAGFGYHFDNMKLDIGEPAFLPSRKIEGSQLLGSLRASFGISRPTLLGTTLTTSSGLPAKPLDSPSNTSQLHLAANTALDQTQTTHHNHQPSSFISPIADDHRSIDTTDANADTKDNTNPINNSKRKMVFGPNLSRATLTQPSSDPNKDTNSASSSAGSSFSDFSDYSVTRSAMEDAMLSNLNNGSKMSSLAFSKKLT